MFARAKLAAGEVYTAIQERQKFRRKKLFLSKPHEQPDLLTQVGLPTIREQVSNQYRLLSKDHRQHIAEVLVFKQESEKSEAEKGADRTLVLAVTSLGLTTVGRLLYAPLGFAGVLLVLYLITEIFKYAAKSLLQRRRLTADVLDLFLTLGIVSGGYFAIAGLGISLMALGRKLMARTEDVTHKQLINIFGEQPQLVWLWVNGAEVEVPFAQITVGDIVLISAGQTIPVDGTIINGTAAIDQHMLTGEAQLVERGIGESVLASTVLITGKIQVRVEKTGQETIAAQIGQVLNQTTDFKELIVARSLRITDAATLPTLALGTLALPVTGTSGALAILACSAGYNLRLTGPISMLNFLQSASQQGILLKDGRSLELLQQIDTVVFDKTGTLTIEELQIAEIHLLNSLTADEILAYAAAAEERQRHPIAQAIGAAATARKLTLPTIDDIHYAVGLGIQTKILDGAMVRVGSARYMQQSQIALPGELQAIQEQSQERGHSLVMVALDDEIVGAIQLQPTLRAEVQDVISTLRQRNLDLYILSGDQEAPTKQLAQQLGMDRYFANTLPEDKAKIVEALQAEGRAICFVGDGINDAIALKKANVSISLKGATTVATDAAQIVLMDGSLGKLPFLFEMSHQFAANMRTNTYISIAPAIFCVAGVFVLQWGLLSSFLIYNAGLLTGMLNGTRPLLSENESHPDLDAERLGHIGQ